MPDADKVKQELELEVSFNEQSANQAVRGIEDLGEKIKEKVNAPTKEAVKNSKDLSGLLGKDLTNAVGKFSGALGPLVSLGAAGGPIAALAVGFVIMDGTLASLEKTAIRVANQFGEMNSNVVELALSLNELSRLGLSEESAIGTLDVLTRSGAFSNIEQVQGAATSAAVLSQRTGIDPREISSMISQLVKGGLMSSTNTLGPSARILADFNENAGKARMSLSGYTKTVMELWNNTKGMNLSLNNATNIVDNFSDEIRKGIFSLSEISNFATGRQSSQQSQLFLAQALDIKGSPLEMLTKMQELRATPEGQNQIIAELRKMTENISSNKDEQVQIIQKLAAIFAPELNVNNLRKARNLLGEEERLLITPDEKKAEDKAQGNRLKAIEETNKILRDTNKLLANIEDQVKAQRSFLDEGKQGMSRFLRALAAAPAALTGDKPLRNLERLEEEVPDWLYKLVSGVVFQGPVGSTLSSAADLAGNIPFNNFVETGNGNGGGTRGGGGRPITVQTVVQTPGQGSVVVKSTEVDDSSLDLVPGGLIRLPPPAAPIELGD